MERPGDWVDLLASPVREGEVVLLAPLHNCKELDDVLAAEGIDMQMISTSEIKISVVVDEKYLELAVRALHQTFDLALEDAS